MKQIKIEMDKLYADRPVFVIGTPRSGTTLMAKILGRHPDLFMPGETHFFEDIYARRDELGKPENTKSCHAIAERLSNLYERYYELPDQKRIDNLFHNFNASHEILTSCQDYTDILTWFMSIQMEGMGKSRWGNNAPRDLFHFREIHNFYPDAKFVISVRDPRDFLLSYKGKWKITGDKHVERLKKLYHPVITSLLWKSSMRLLDDIKQTIPNENFIIVNYESLVHDPEKIITAVCETIDVKYRPELLKVDSHNSSSGDQGHGIFTSSIEKWKNDLSPEEIIISQWIVGKEMNGLGYQIEDKKTNIMRLIMLIGSTPFALWNALQANKDVRGPLFPYLAKRVASLMGIRIKRTSSRS